MKYGLLVTAYAIGLISLINRHECGFLRAASRIWSREGQAPEMSYQISTLLNSYTVEGRIDRRGAYRR